MLEWEEEALFAVLAPVLGDTEADRLMSKLFNYSNNPNQIKGVVKMPSNPKQEAALLSVVDNPANHAVLGLELKDEGYLLLDGMFWGLLALAARADATVLDRIEPLLVTESSAPRLMAMVRRATTKYLAAQG